MIGKVAMMGLRPCQLLVSVAALLIRSVVEGDKGQRMYSLCDSTTPYTLQISHETRPFVIKDPFYPFNSKSEKCLMRLESGPTPLVLSLDFKEFNFKQNGDCREFSLCTFGVTLCSDWVAGKTLNYILPPNQMSTIILKRDVNKVVPPFYVNVEIREAINGEQVKEQRGHEFQSPGLYVTTVNYSPGTPYMDFCYIANEYKSYKMCEPDPNEILKVNYTEKPFLIQNPDYDAGSYSRFVNCQLILASDGEPMTLLFQYIDFKMQFDAQCKHRFLCVHGVNFCMDWVVGKTFQSMLPAYSNLTLRLKSEYDNAIFMILVRPAEALTTNPVEEIRGDGSREAGIYKVNVTYNYTTAYKDLCYIVPEKSSEQSTTTTEQITPATCQNTASIASTASTGQSAESSGQSTESTGQSTESFDNAVHQLIKALQLLVRASNRQTTATTEQSTASTGQSTESTGQSTESTGQSTESTGQSTKSIDNALHQLDKALHLLDKALHSISELVKLLGEALHPQGQSQYPLHPQGQSQYPLHPQG